MHIQEGMLSNSTAGVIVLGAGYALTAVGTAIGLRRLDYQQMPRVALLAAAFFVASFIHVALPPTEVHLVLNGLVGLVLGWAAFPALLVSLLLQALFFNFGGLTTLGINTLSMALPAVACHYLFRGLVRSRSQLAATIGGAAAGGLAIVLSLTIVAVACFLADGRYQRLAEIMALVSLALAIGEALVTASAVAFLRKVAPEVLGAPGAAARQAEVSHA